MEYVFGVHSESASSHRRYTVARWQFFVLITSVYWLNELTRHAFLARVIFFVLMLMSASQVPFEDTL